MSERSGALALLLGCALGCACSTREAPAAGRGASAASATAPGAHYVLTGATVVGQGAADVEIDGARIARVGAAGSGSGGGEQVELPGKYLVPAFIDSHVHLAYYAVGPELTRAGIAAAVDMAAPLASFGTDLSPLVVVRSGPMITAPGGYPTQSWGKDGYGHEVADVTAAGAAVDTLSNAGARLIKFPLTEAPTLELPVASAVVARAHSLELKVAVHALGTAQADMAATSGADLLAHTPVEPLPELSVGAWAEKAVVSTLAAFGGSPNAIANLRALRDAGAIVLYGTDLGNTRSAGIQSSELTLLAQAGLDGAAIIAAGTSAPAAYWQLAELGAIAPGKRASLLVLGEDPLLNPLALSTPEAVYIDGKRVTP